jgi:TPR repeat protein
MYHRGQGVMQDYAAAMRWLKLATGQGDAQAQSNLGVMYAEGQGVSQDQVRAYMWTDLAAAQGYKLAAQNRDMLAKKMTQQQIAEAKNLVIECLARDYKNCD